jgi:ribonuclease BN (tRNA processing enzyme)
MEMLFVGTGAAFTLPARDEAGHDIEPRNWQSNVLLRAPSGQTLCIDCGGDARHSLWEQGLTHRDIGSVYITHPHADHIGGLEWLAFSSRFDPGYQGLGAEGKPILWVPRPYEHSLWEDSLRGGLRAIHGAATELADFFDVRPVDEGFSFGRTDFTTVPGDHIDGDSWVMRSYGLLFGEPGRRVYFSGDVSRSDQLMAAYQQADLIFHDCEILPFQTQVHTHIEQLRTLPLEFRQRMWLYGYQPGPRPHIQEDGFKGFVAPGQRFDLHDSFTFQGGTRR